VAVGGAVTVAVGVEDGVGSGVAVGEGTLVAVAVMGVAEGTLVAVAVGLFDSAVDESSKMLKQRPEGTY